MSLGMGSHESHNRSRNRSQISWRGKIDRNPQLYPFVLNFVEQLPIAAHIPAPYGTRTANGASMTFTACDTRTSNSHPLRHAVVNAIRRMADHQVSAAVSSPETSAVASPCSTETEERRNGTSYLLTSLTLFTTHEPCIMCSMALIHSRVKEVFYLYPMVKTGGCGGVTCLSTLKGVNHRFGICQWKAEGTFSKCDLDTDATTDA
jgi:tRNA-specific adenosine deaminase 3